MIPTTNQHSSVNAASVPNQKHIPRYCLVWIQMQTWLIKFQARSRRGLVRMNGSPRILFCTQAEEPLFSTRQASLSVHLQPVGSVKGSYTNLQGSWTFRSSPVYHTGQGKYMRRLLGDLASALHMATKQTGLLASCLIFHTHEMKAWTKCFSLWSLGY